MSLSWCLIRFVVGIDCPACGLTRSIVALLQGDLFQSIALHPMGVMVVLWVANLWWWRRMDLSRTSRQLISHAVLGGFFIPWVIGFFI